MEQKSAATNAARSQSHNRTRSNGIKARIRPDNVKTRMQQAENDTLSVNNLEMDENITENIATLKEQVEIAIKSVDENLIDSMLVGQTKIQKNKAVILSWSLDHQNGPHPPSPLESQDASVGHSQTKDDGNSQEDGIVLYVAIKMKKKAAAGPPQVEEDQNNNCSTELSRRVNN